MAVATGWETVYPVLRLPGCRARAYFVQDHEPEFFATSAEAVLAEHTYRFGLALHRRRARWLAGLLRERYGAEATAFAVRRGDRGVPPGARRAAPRPTRSSSTRATTRPGARVELGLLALQLLVEQRPHLRVVLYGTHRRIRAPFAFEQLGVEDTDRLRRLYSEATVGLSLSLTNHSLIAGEMLACGLPVVELAGRACEAVYGATARWSRWLSDDPGRHRRAAGGSARRPGRRERLSRAGLEFVRTRTWEGAADSDRAGSASDAARLDPAKRSERNFRALAG